MRQIGRHLAFPSVVFAATLGVCAAEASDGRCEARVSTIAFTSARGEPADTRPGANWEIWLMDGDGANPRRLTVNTVEGFGDFSAVLSRPRARKIVFDSNRARAAGEPVTTTDLFLMNQDGTEQTLLTRGSSASWSPKGKRIAFHRSASFTVPPAVGDQRQIRPEPGAPALDSDLFVAKVRDLLDGEAPENITNTDLYVEDDADWSPNGKKIAFTRHPRSDNQQNSVHAEICVMKVKGHREPRCFLAENGEEERAPDWSPDGTRLAYMCRKGAPSTPTGTTPSFEICVIKADGTGEVRRLTTNAVFDGTPQWSPDGQTILFSSGPTLVSELWLMNADGTGEPAQFTDTEGLNGFSNWGKVCADDEDDDDDDGDDDDEDDEDDQDDQDDDDDN